MSANHNNGPNIFGPLTLSEFVHNRLMDALSYAKESDHPFFDSDENEHDIPGILSDNVLSEWLHVTGRQGENEMLLIDSQGNEHTVDFSVHRFDVYRDAPQLGRDVEGDPTELMRLDPRAEIVTRQIAIYYAIDKNPYGEQDMTAGWHVYYDGDEDSQWFIGFWSGNNPMTTENPKDWVEPSQEEMELFAQMLDYTERTLGVTSF